jgi:uncharacterized protein
MRLGAFLCVSVVAVATVIWMTGCCGICAARKPKEAGYAVQPDTAAKMLKAANEGDAATVIQLLRSDRATAYVAGPGGATPLHEAVFNNQKDTVVALLAGGANVNAAKQDGWTPLHFAAWRGNLDIAKLLVAAGANVEARNTEGATPLELAPSSRQNAVADFLRASGQTK